MLRPILAAAVVCALPVAGYGSLRFFDEPARPVVVLILAAGLGLMWSRMRVRERTEQQVAGQNVVAVVSMLLSVAALAGVPWLDAHTSLAAVPSGLRWVGVLLVLIAEALMVWALAALGRWYTPRVAILPGHELVTSGPYRFVRHPIYTAILLDIAGAPLAFGTWLGIPVVVIAFVSIAIRIRQEESLLEHNFGDAYRALRERTSRLIPRVW